ncbi:hypothetical protein PG985_014284 [Apiospora marii]|uniref:uncharacterized protein n=1 Tax=Apiospora marii TaxID=335849 RepID=UPI0031322326
MSASSTSSTPPDITPSVVPNGAPPPGHESHFDEAAPSQAWIPLLAVYTTLPVAIALVLLRVYVRIRLRDGLASEDYLCILAGFRPVVYILQSFQDLLTLFPHLSGVLGRHAWDIPEAVITAEVMKEISATTMMNLLAAASIKYSLLVLFRRIFSPLPRSKLMIRIGIIFTSVSFVVLSVVWIVYSVPLPGEGGWDSRIFREREGSATPLISMALGAVNTFLDFYLVAVSLSSISALKLSLSRKIGVSAVFATGLLLQVSNLPGLPRNARAGRMVAWGGFLRRSCGGGESWNPMRLHTNMLSAAEGLLGNRWEDSVIHEKIYPETRQTTARA